MCIEGTDTAVTPGDTPDGFEVTTEGTTTKTATGIDVPSGENFEYKETSLL